MDITHLIDRFPLAGLFLLLVLGALGLPFPEDMTLVLCGFLIANEIVRPAPVLLLIYVLMVGIDVLFFYAGRKYGYEIVNHRNFRRIISRDRVERLEQTFQKWGVLFVVLGRQLVVLRTQLLIATGIFRMPPWKFLITDLITVPVTMAIMIGLGYAGASSLQIVRKDVSRIEHLTTVIVVAAVVAWLLYRALKTRFHRG